MLRNIRRMSTLKEKIRPARFAARLTAESVVPSVKNAVELYESDNDLDKLAKFNKPRMLESGAFQYTIPTERQKYLPLLSSPRAIEELGLEEDDDMKKLVSGEKFHYDSKIFPYAQAYAGFQFGQFAGQLGDGRVVNLFDIESPNGERFELQLKGAGKTAFSRFADGKATVRSSIREFVIAEALHGIGIPSARTLYLSVLPGTLAQRSYAEQCAVVARFAQSWIRMGTFDLYRYRKDRKGLRELCDYVIQDILQDLPPFVPGKYKVDQYMDITEGEEPPADHIIDIEESTRYDQMYRAIVRLNAQTVAYWQVYGFLNGVLNTDNTSIIGISMDFGPFSFLDRFDPKYTPNHDDVQLRYSYENQPSIVWWNLTRLGESLVELLGAGPDLVDDEFFVDVGVREDCGDNVLKRAQSIIQLASNEYKCVFMDNYNELMRKRLGLKSFKEGDNHLFAELLDILLKTQVDYNQFFVALQASDLTNHLVFLSRGMHERYDNPRDRIDVERNDEIREMIKAWLDSYNLRLQAEGITHEQRREIACAHNPLFIPRNWMLDEVICEVEDSRGEEFGQLAKLLKMSSYPYDSTKWGSELKDLEAKWTANEADSDKFMKQCSCSS
jgi:uncharacterized protein YdiU (UPF0061 family)